MKNTDIFQFKVGKKYYCISSDKRSDDCFFEFGKIYTCAEVENTKRFSFDLQQDHSTIKFYTENGHKVSYFGCHALQHFTNDIKVLEESLLKRIKSDIEYRSKKQEDIFNYEQRLIKWREEEQEFTDKIENNKKLLETLCHKTPQENHYAIIDLRKKEKKVWVYRNCE